MDRGVRAIVSHRLPNAEELNAGCSDWLECCQAYIHKSGCAAMPTETTLPAENRCGIYLDAALDTYCRLPVGHVGPHSATAQPTPASARRERSVAQVKLTPPELNHLIALLEAERESGEYAGPREQYYARTERLIQWCNDQVKGHTDGTSKNNRNLSR